MRRLGTSSRYSAILRAAAWFSLIGYFFYLNWAGLSVHFALDELANVRHYYFQTSPLQLIVSQFVPWRGDYRPMGGLFYIPIYHLAGLNPIPYQAALLALMGANVYLVYRFSIALGSTEAAAYLAALVACYHAGLANLYYNGAFVYDAMCGLFMLAALTYYLRVRARGRLLNIVEKGVFLLLFLCALNSKEMALTLPGVVLLYEWLYHPPDVRSFRALRQWLLGPARMVLIAGLLDAADLFGKVVGPQALAAAEGYRPVFTLARLFDFQTNLLQDLFLAWQWTPGRGTILVLWALLGFAAWYSRRPVLRFLFWFLLIVAIPIEFLPGKRGGCFFLPMVGAAIFAASVLVDLSAAVAGRFPPRLQFAVSAVILLTAAFWWVDQQRRFQAMVSQGQMAPLGSETWDIIQQFPRFAHPHSGSGVAFLKAPLPGNDMWSLALLWLHDPSVEVHVWTQGALSPEQLNRMEHVYTFEDRKLIQLK